MLFVRRNKSLVINLVLTLSALVVAVILQSVWNPRAVSAAKDEVCICHATGQAGTTHFVTVCANRTAIFGQAGHFYEDGTPRAGHEDDYLGPCNEPSPPPSPEPSPSPGL